MKPQLNNTDLQVAMLQMDIAHNPARNADRIWRWAKRARRQGADIIVGSEMMLGHYLCGDCYEDDGYIAELYEAVLQLAREWRYDTVLIIGGLALGAPGEVGEDGRQRKYNAAFVIQNGRLVKNVAGLPFAIKSLLPNYRIFDDSRHFFSLRQVADEQGVPLQSLQQPFPVTIRGQQFKLGVMLCEDMWDIDYAQQPAKILVENGADVLINISASPWSWQKNRKRDQIVQDICQATGVPFVYVNNVGVQNNGKNFVVFDGASTVYDAAGTITTMAPRYEAKLVLATLSPATSGQTRPDQPDVAELYQAIKVATRGYLQTLPEQVGRKVVIGVSGGIDSAVSVAFFAKLLSPANVIAVNLPYGSFNSSETRDDAAQLCRRLGVEYRVVPIDQMVDGRCAALGIEQGTATHKTTQAIERLSVLAAVASHEQAFFTCNANMTEIAFGYGTLNGDLRGTWAPWQNCLKQDMYRLAVYLNEVVYKREVIPQRIIDRPPMDELTSPDAGERSDPFHYGSATENGYHDQLVRALVSFRRSPEWFLEEYLSHTLEEELRLPAGTLFTLFPTSESFVADLERCLRLFQAAIFKRVQSVPGPLVDKRSFGFDLRESVVPWVETARYRELRDAVLGG